MKDLTDKAIIGIYFGKISAYSERYRWKYYPIEKNYDIKSGEMTFETEKCEFSGELKFEDGKFFIDTTLIDIKKYNI